MTDIDDDDCWIELEAHRVEKVDADVTLRLTKVKGKGKARAYLCFRRQAAQWISANAPRFRVAIGGVHDDLIRIVPDLHGGKFENLPFKGVERLVIGHVELWPDESRAPVAVEWDATVKWMKLTLPKGFTDPKAAE